MQSYRVQTGCVLLVLLALPFASTSAQEAGRHKDEAFEWIDANTAMITGVSDRIWEYAELPQEEFRSAALLAETLEKHGFRVERGVAGMPTAFVATYGSGEPVVGFLAEFDALPGLSQKAVPHKEALVEGGSGHGCGHNLLGTGSTAAAMAVKHVMERFKLGGTVKLFGCPNEENDIGKTFMARAGVFSTLDAAVDWHPASDTGIALMGSHAIHNFTITFTGKTAHAGGDPWDGRSALDGVELTNIAVNYLREHVKPTVRIQYAVIEGGSVPNVVPDRAVAWYNTRDVTFEGSDEVYRKVRTIADAMAVATETEVEIELLTAIHELLVIEESSDIMQANLELVGPPAFTPEEQVFARAVQRSLGIEEAGLADGLLPLTPPSCDEFGGGGTDVAEVSWNTPVLRMGAATHPLGAPGHSWAVVCTGSTSIAHKGMLVAAKTLAATVIDLLTRPEVLEQVRSEWKKKTAGRPYESPLPPGAVPPVVQTAEHQ